MYDNRGIDKSSSNISKISSIKSKSSSMNKSKSSSSANKKKELLSKMKNIREQNLNDNSLRGGKYSRNIYIIILIHILQLYLQYCLFESLS